MSESISISILFSSIQFLLAWFSLESDRGAPKYSGSNYNSDPHVHYISLNDILFLFKKFRTFPKGIPFKGQTS